MPPRACAAAQARWLDQPHSFSVHYTWRACPRTFADENAPFPTWTGYLFEATMEDQPALGVDELAECDVLRSGLTVWQNVEKSALQMTLWSPSSRLRARLCVTAVTGRVHPLTVGFRGTARSPYALDVQLQVTRKWQQAPSNATHTEAKSCHCGERVLGDAW